MTDTRKLAALFVLPAGLFLVQVPAWSHALGIGLDDAYIGFIYARNLVEHTELTYNAGGERVEGYTHFLWLLVMAIAHALGLPLPPFFKAAGVLAALGLLWLLMLLERASMGERARLPLRAALLAAATASLPLYAVSGIETTAFAALVALGAFLHVGHRPVISALVFGLAALTRPEGVLFFAVSCGHRLLERAGASEIARRLAVFGAIVGPHFLFRRLYYGLWLPHSFYVKAGGYDQATQWKNGFTQLRAFYEGPGRFLLVLLVSMLVLHRPWNRAKAYFVLSAAAHAVYLCSIGFDFMAKDRHQMMGYPFLMPLAAMGISAWEGLLERVAKAAAVILGVGLVVLGVATSWDRDMSDIEFHKSASLGDIDIRYEIGLHLRATTAEGTLLATGECGKIPYFAGRPNIDLSGLNDLAIGKTRPYVQAKPAPLPLHEILRRRPGVVLIPNFQLGLWPEPVADISRLSPVSTFRDPEFLARYDLSHERVQGLHFYCFRLRAIAGFPGPGSRR